VDKVAQYQGATLQLGEKLNERHDMSQGTTLVVPQMPQNQRGL
jgi:hypothetical protein